MLSKFSKKFSRNSNRHKFKKGRENLWEILDKFYLQFDKILNKICEIFKQILKRLEFL